MKQNKSKTFAGGCLGCLVVLLLIPAAVAAFLLSVTYWENFFKHILP